MQTILKEEQDGLNEKLQVLSKEIFDQFKLLALSMKKMK